MGFAHPEIPRITAEKLKLMMDDGEDFILVDTRLLVVYEIDHLPGAISIEIPAESDIDGMEIAEVKLLTLPRDELIILY